MGLFSKLFSKKGSAPPPPQEERKFFDSPYCRFYYTASPAVGEFGYEGTVDRGNGTDGTELYLFVETDSPDSANAGLCYARLEAAFSDPDRIDLRVKKLVTDYFMLKPAFRNEERSLTEQELIDNTDILWIGFFRNGDIQFDVEAYEFYATDIMLTIKTGGSIEIRYRDYDNTEHHDTL